MARAWGGRSVGVARAHRSRVYEGFYGVTLHSVFEKLRCVLLFLILQTPVTTQRNGLCTHHSLGMAHLALDTSFGLQRSGGPPLWPSRGALVQQYVLSYSPY